MNHEIAMTKRTQVKRSKERANYNTAKIFAALDEALVGTIAFSDGTNVHAIPTAIWRNEDYLYIHGSNGSRLLKFLQAGEQVCVSITNMHGLVLARSAFHHSMNYSSVCIYGSFELVADAEKTKQIKQFLDHWTPGRWEHVRAPDKNELAATTFMRISIKEAVLKSRQGPPKDDAEDMEQTVWAGVMPVRLQWQQPQQAAEQGDLNFPGKNVRSSINK